ncbi:MAG: PRC-barrel domain-containing protein [Anaerolineales bacterium]
MNIKRILFSSVVIVSLVLAACAPATDTTLTPGPLGTDIGTDATFPTKPVLGTATGEGVMTPETTAVATAAATAMPAGTETQAVEQPLFIRASDLVGLDIEGASGAKLGEVDEVLVNQEGEVQYLVFDAFVTTATGRRLLPLEWTMLKIDQGDDTIVYTGTEADLEATTPLVDTDYDAPGFVWDNPITGTQVTAEDSLIRVGRFTDFDLRNNDDEDLGEVDDMVIDLKSGMVTHAIVNFGGFLGIGEKSVVVPWQQFTLDQTQDNQDVMRLNVSRETLEAAPAIDNMDTLLPRWPETILPGWDQDAVEFWRTAGLQ